MDQGSVRALRSDLINSGNLSIRLASYHTQIRSKQFNAQTCEALLSEMLREISEIDINTFNVEMPLTEFKIWMTQIFELRTLITSRWGDFDHSVPDLMESRVQILRLTLNAFRLLEDRLILWRLNPKPFDPQNDVAAGPLFQGEIPELLSKFDGDVTIRSGDIMLSRAPVYVSSIMARISEIESIFSHLVFIYIDAPVGTELNIQEAMSSSNVFIIQAHSRNGATVQPFSQYMALDTYARVGLLRARAHADECHRAATYARDLVANFAKAKMQAAGRKKPSVNDNIPFDFKFDFQDESSLFCSELIVRSFRTVGIPMPHFASRLRKNHVAEIMAVTVDRIFSPSDMETEPHFQLLAEWRDLRRLNEINLTDAVFDAAFRWMEELKYVVQLSKTDRILGSFLWWLRRVDFAFQNEFQKHVRPSDISTRLFLDRFGKTMTTHLKNFEKDYRHLYPGRLPSQQELFDELERFRQEDAAAFAAGEPTFFHQNFRPRTA